MKPDHKTISDFRRANKKALKLIIKQCARLCLKLGLIEGNTLFVDGSKIRANASINNTFTKEKADRLLQNIDQRIEQILDECDRVDAQEQSDPSLITLQEELKNKQALKSKVEAVLKELKEEGKTSLNATDKKCVKVKGRQGTHAGYNSQIVVDNQQGLIVNSDVVAQSNDSNQFSPQIEQAQEVLGHPCKNACADAGYVDADDLKKIADQNIKVIVPSQKQAHQRKVSPFDKEHFSYDPKQDGYICPIGQVLPYAYFDAYKNQRVYQIPNKALCLACQNYGICTKAKYGRRIKRLKNEESKLKLEKQFEQKQSQQIYRLRKEKVEHPFGHIKRNLGVTAFLLRGLDGVKAEMSLLASCFNILRLLTIYGGTQQFIAKLST